MYGLSTPDSDTDYKAIYLPEIRDIILGNVKRNITTSTGGNDSKNSKDDIDFEVFSLHEFIRLATQGQMVAIDALHQQANLSRSKDTEIWSFLVENRTKFYSKNMKSFVSYARKQAAKYGIKGSRVKALEDVLKVCGEADQLSHLSSIRELLPITEYTKFIEKDSKEYYDVNGSLNDLVIPVSEFKARVQKHYNNYGARAILAKDNKNVDWKSISHAFRAAYQMKDIFTKGDFEYPLKETKLILSIKKGELDYPSVVAPMLGDLMDEIQTLSDSSNLPDEVNTEFWDDYIVNLYQDKAQDEDDYPIEQSKFSI